MPLVGYLLALGQIIGQCASGAHSLPSRNLRSVAAEFVAAWSGGNSRLARPGARLGCSGSRNATHGSCTPPNARSPVRDSCRLGERAPPPRTPTSPLPRAGRWSWLESLHRQLPTAPGPSSSAAWTTTGGANLASGRAAMKRRLVTVLVPLYPASQPLFETDFRLVTEGIGCVTDVGASDAGLAGLQGPDFDGGFPT